MRWRTTSDRQFLRALLEDWLGQVSPSHKESRRDARSPIQYDTIRGQRWVLGMAYLSEDRWEPGLQQSASRCSECLPNSPTLDLDTHQNGCLIG